MRKTHNHQPSLSSKTILDLISPHHTRDDIDKLLMGLSTIFEQPVLRRQILDLMREKLDLPESLGREGMNYWTIFVLGALRVSLDADYDRIQNLANNHRGIRQVLGHSDWDAHQSYGLTSIKDNVRLMGDELLDCINTLVVKYGRKIVHPYQAESSLIVACDSYVGLMDVHFPTDISLLYDGARKTQEILAKFCQEHGIKGMRQYKYHRKQLKALLRRAGRSKKQGKDDAIKAAHRAYGDYAEKMLNQAKLKVAELKSENIVFTPQVAFDYFVSESFRILDLMRRRVLQGETIPHHEKPFSLHEPHAEWINKGKSGVPVELGLKVAVCQDQYQFILHHRVMQKEQDVDIAVLMAQAVIDKYGEMDSISFDRGFWSAENNESLQPLAKKVVLPKKGYINQERQAIEDEKEFKRLKRKHSAVESGIHDLQCHGLDKVPDRGIDGYKRYIALGILGFNLHKIGSLVLKKHYRRERKRAA